MFPQNRVYKYHVLESKSFVSLRKLKHVIPWKINVKILIFKGHLTKLKDLFSVEFVYLDKITVHHLLCGHCVKSEVIVLDLGIFLKECKWWCKIIIVINNRLLDILMHFKVNFMKKYFILIFLLSLWAVSELRK